MLCLKAIFISRIKPLLCILSPELFGSILVPHLAFLGSELPSHIAINCQKSGSDLLQLIILIIHIIHISTFNNIQYILVKIFRVFYDTDVYC